MQLRWKTWRRLGRDARGSEIAETAMVVPLFFMIFLGIFWFGQAFRIYGAMTSAARDGARAAVAPACTTCAGVDPTTNAWNIIQSDLQAAHIDPNVLQQPTNPPALCACGGIGATANCTSTTVSCDSAQTNICVQGVNHSGKNNTVNETYVQLSPTVASGALTTGSGECGVSVSFQYPFTFSQAQMRAENQ